MRITATNFLRAFLGRIFIHFEFTRMLCVFFIQSSCMVQLFCFPLIIPFNYKFPPEWKVLNACTQLSCRHHIIVKHTENMEQIHYFAEMKIHRKTRLRAEILCSNSCLITKIKAILWHSSGTRASCVACIVAFLYTQSLWRMYSFITFLLFDAFQ